jgi:hypothetical protein
MVLISLIILKAALGIILPLSLLTELTLLEPDDLAQPAKTQLHSIGKRV